jgi:hypothetical protein
MGAPQMGEGNSSANKIKYNILYGQFRRRVEEGTEGAMERKLEKGKNKGAKIWELGFSSFAGYIKKVQLHENDFGTDIAIDMGEDEKGSAEATIYIPLYSAQGRSFLNTMLNSAPTDPTRLTLWQKNAEARTILFIAQWNGDKWEDIERKYNVWIEEESRLDGLPAAIPVKVQGKDTWDYTEHTEVLTGEFQKNVLPLIQKEGFLYDPKQNEEEAAPKEKAKAPAMGAGAPDDIEDDLPF